jgi:hypothetical protein
MATILTYFLYFLSNFFFKFSIFSNFYMKIKNIFLSFFLFFKGGAKRVFVGNGNNDKLVRDYFKEKVGEFSVMDVSEKYNNGFYFKWV